MIIQGGIFGGGGGGGGGGPPLMGAGSFIGHGVGAAGPG